MSESDKMGLFGSKDENPETQNDNKDPAKGNPDTSSHQRHAPYNIDSDSDTYDTEALSIMDINDIIGIQADSAGDSTLESEFAALSEVITDIKGDELNLENVKGVGKSDRDRNVGSTGDKASEKDSTKEVSQTDDNKSSESAGMAGINKSLQLIGEAYDSDDSQETDNDEMPTCIEKTANLGETIKAPSNENVEVQAKDSGAIVAGEEITPNECPIEQEKNVAVDKPAETAEKSTERDLKSLEIDKSVDATDSPATVVFTRKNEDSKTENMNVASDVGETEVEKSPEIETVVKLVEKKELVAGSEISTSESVVEAEEPMEVDEPIKEPSTAIETEKTDSVAAEEAIENNSESINLAEATETTITKPESEKSIGDVLDNTEKSPAPEITTESVNDNVSKEEASKSAVEKIEAQKIDNVKESSISSKDEQVAEEKLEMETDDNVSKEIASKSSVEDIEAKKIDEVKIKEPSISSKDDEIAGGKVEMETDDAQVEKLVEKVELKSPTKLAESVLATIEEVSEEAEEDNAKNSPSEAIVEQQEIAESLEQAGEIVGQDISLVERVKTPDEEPMEIDDNAGYLKSDCDKRGSISPNLSDNTVDTVETVANIVEPLKHSAGDEPAEIASDSHVSSSETSKIEAAADNPVEESAKTDTGVSSSVLSVNSAEPAGNSEEQAVDAPEISSENAESSLIDKSKENANDKRDVSEITASPGSAIAIEAMETEDIIPKENLTEEVPESTKKIPEVEEIPDVLRREFVEAAGDIASEDEKMEVDSGAKKEKENEKGDSCPPNEGSKDDLSVSTSQKLSLVEEKPAVEEAGESVEVKESENVLNVEKVLEIPSDSVESSEAKATESVDETDEAKQSLKEELPSIKIDKTLEIAAAENKSESEEKTSEKESLIDENTEEVLITPAEAIEESSDDKENSTEAESRETKSSISTTITESSTVTTQESEAVEISGDLIKEDATKAEEKSQPETAVLTNVEKAETLAESSDTKEPEVSSKSTEKNANSEKDETASVTMEEEKESDIKKPEPSAGDEIQIAEEFEAIEKDVEEENIETEAESKKSLMSIDIASKSAESTEPADELIEDTKERTEESTSLSIETEDPVLSVAESQFEFPKPETPQQETIRIDLSSSSINPEDVEGEEDPMEEEMNLSLDPDVGESQESDSREVADEEAQRVGDLSLEDIPVDAEEMEDQVDLDLSLDPEEKIEDSSSGRDSGLAMNSSAEKAKQSDERLEKPNEVDEEDDDENSKEIIPSMVNSSGIFHDEQSQNTQEMMDSILETDSSNFNKVLDDEEAEIDELAAKLPSASEELLDKALDDPMASQNIDSLEGLLDLDLIQEGDESTMKSVDPIVGKVMNEEDIETKDVDVSLLLEETDQGESVDRDEYPNAAEDNTNVLSKVVEKVAEEIAVPCENLSPNTVVNETIDSPAQLEAASSVLVQNDIDETLELLNVEPNPVEAAQTTSDESKLSEELLRKIDEERKIAEDLLLETTEKGGDITENLLLQTALQEKTDVLPADVLLTAAVVVERGLELVEDILMENPIEEDTKMESPEDILPEKVLLRDQVLTAAAEIEDLPPTSEISELESAVKFLQESEEQTIDSPLVLSPKLVESVVDEIVREDDVALFVTGADICADPSALVAELEDIIPDPIAISEAEIISEAAKLENERKTKLTEEAKLQSPIPSTVDERKEKHETKPPEIPETSATVAPHPETPKTHREARETPAKSPIASKIEETQLLKKSAPIPKISILEERLKEPPKIEIPSVGEVSRMCETPTTPKTSLLIQRDSKLASFQAMLESPKASDKSELKIVDTPRKDTDKHDFENVGSPRIILKIAKSAIADCGEPRSPKSPKIRSATNSPNPDDSPGQKLGKIKLKLSKGGHPSIISNDNVEEVCGQWHTEGTSSLSPLGMKIKFSKIADTSTAQTDKHEEDTKEPTKHKFEEAKRTESPIGMKIKFSKTGDPSIVHPDVKESTSKHKDKTEIMQGSPKRNESPIGMKIKLSKSGDASIIQPEKLESSEEHREAGSSRGKEKLDVPQDVPKRTESPLGMKFKLFKTGDASIVASEIADELPQETKRTDSPLGMKIKLSKTRGSASIVQTESSEDFKERLEVPEVPRRTESPLGVKIKLSKTGDASIIHSEDGKETAKHKERAETSQEAAQAPETCLGVKIKVSKSRDTSSFQPEVTEISESISQKRGESSIGMKFKLSKTGDASIVHSETQVEDSRAKEKPEIPQETTRKPDVAIGMKIKFSKTGEASILQPQSTKKTEEASEGEISHQRPSEVATPMKIKLQRSGDATIVETEKKDKSMRRKETDSPLEMKIKLSKTGHATIIASENYGESSQKVKEASAEPHKHKDSTTPKEVKEKGKEMPGMKMLKSMHGNVTIEPVQQARKAEVVSETSKRKDVTISPIESKKAKLEAQLSHMLPEVTIQPIKPREPKQPTFDAKSSSISRQQMNVISQEISITQVRSSKAMDLSMTDKLKSMLAKNATTSGNTDCEIIEHRPELIIVNENSNSSQDVMIIEEVPALRGPEVKVPKKRGRPRRNPLPLVIAKPGQPIIPPGDSAVPRDPLALDDVPHLIPQIVSQTVPPVATQRLPPKENERPKRTCSRQKSYAPPKRGRGRGRGKRKMEMDHMELSKKPRIEQDLDMIEQSTTALITVDDSPPQVKISHSTSELYKALRQPPMDHKMANAISRVEAEQAVNDADLLAKDTREALMDSRIMSHLDGVIENSMNKSSAEAQSCEPERKMSLDSICESAQQQSTDLVTEEIDKSEIMIVDVKSCEKNADETKDNKDTSNTQDHQNWLTPSSKKSIDGRNEGNISNVQAIDEETRMSAESSSRSQTPAKNMSLQAPETIVNEESQGSVLSTATTESEKVKVKNRRMEISFDPDEGPFTVDKVAEYEWPPDPTRKGETFMIQEQISQYLGVKSFKRKYPDLKRRMVDMEERNFLRENGLVSEAMCDMGLTAVSSSEVLDIMCNDFPDQYEEYRKYIREKQMKEHSKKQKELTAAANAERNRIDLAEMAVQSALSWNVGLNKARRESRKCSLDLQTFTIHVPKKQQKVEEESRQSNYPVALIPGQYTDYYREYTPAELRYYPLNTVLYGPMKPNERKLDSQSEGSQSDSDSDSSSDDSSSSSSDGTQDTEESQSTMDEVDVELSRQKEDIKSIKCKMCLKHLNKFSRTEVLIQCGTCNGYVHPSCIDLTFDMVPHIQAYAWQCTDCKTCAQCHDPADEDKMLFCDMCDRGYHIYCVGLRRVPQGRWHCQECAVCASCGSREAGGANSDRNSVAQWQHEYKKGDKNTRVYLSTLCVPCSKLWRKGRYCPHCSRCHTVPRLDLEASLVHCSACDKYLHLGCVETKDLTIGRKNYLCDFCQPSRQQMAKPLVSKVFRT